MSCHVLIIEDEPLIAIDIESMLMACGATSFAFAETEEDAVAAATLAPPDLVTSDVRLRSGTGLEAVETIIEILGPVPVIFITANHDISPSVLGPARVLAKPVQAGALARAFREVTTQGST